MDNLKLIESEVETALKANIEQADGENKKAASFLPSRVSVFGLGYVGIVSSACLAKIGHSIIGVDTNDQTIQSIREGNSPIVEPGLEGLIKKSLDDTNFSVTKDVKFAIANSDISFVCVGTPSAPDGSLDLKYLKIVSKEIGENIRNKGSHHTIVFRSTMEPGTAEKVLTPIIAEASGKKENQDFSVCFHPEFLREGTAIDDFFAPPKTVIGCTSEAAAQKVSALYGGIFETSVITTSMEVAEMVKYVDNTWHAVKVSFANEIGRICQACHTDGHEVMDIFCQDKKLNLSPYYLKPGFAFGGSCLPKDVRGINKLASRMNIETPLLGSVMNSNKSQIDHAVNMIKEVGNKSVTVLGLTFKKDTDDLRETPTIPMIAALLADGYDVKVYDKNIGGKKQLMHYLQHAECADSSVIDFCENFEKYHQKSLSDALKYAQTIVVTHDNDLYAEISAQRRQEQTIVDLVRLFKNDNIPAQILEAGMDSYLQKPAKSADLDAILTSFITSHHSDARKILLAEDNIPMNTMLQLKLTRLGYNVDSVTNGQDAVNLVQAKCYDAILMDLQMPMLDGFEATKCIRQLPDEMSTVPIIALSGNIIPEKSSTYFGLCW